MTAEVLSGDGYRLEFDFRPPLLTVHLRGEAETTLETTREYWLRISERANAYGAEQLLVLDALPGEVMSDEDLVRFFDSVGTLGLEHVRIAYVEGRTDQVSRIEYVELLALERGYRIRMFTNESDARLWLSYGGG
ncbi:hypothetical protein H9L17_02310 [Thermomonas brevis]|uniref:STAS/SEC14 domain-containing protein n=1 Tax=Thermomonas brevis TaxID=215691 RepID=A0A7G9QUJ6_9GAMM|nr:hypothetical protein [Thermomonas brevis]QNN47021.1 hypothetical protein H9L17_02310 [Thermomonas brevis]